MKPLTTDDYDEALRIAIRVALRLCPDYCEAVLAELDRLGEQRIEAQGILIRMLAEAKEA